MVLTGSALIVENSARITLRLPPQVHSRVRQLAAAHGISQNEFIIQTLQDAFTGRTQAREAEKHALASVMWTREYLWGTTSEISEEEKRVLFEKMLDQAEGFFDSTDRSAGSSD